LIEDDQLAPLLELALDAQEVRSELNLALDPRDARIASIDDLRIVRYKASRRCLIEYDVRLLQHDRPAETCTIIGKIRAKGMDQKSYDVQRELWMSGFNSEGHRAFSVPQPLGLVPRLNMWIQPKVAGVPSIFALKCDNNASLTDRIARACSELHRCGVPPRRKPHTLADELRILNERLCELETSRPDLAPRVRSLWRRCEEASHAIAAPETLSTIHRDFYHDQLLVDGPMLWLLDLDLYCNGDRALDIGNFVAHLTDYALRQLGDASALLEVERALSRQWAVLVPESVAASIKTTIDVYTILSLARLVQISTRIPDRRCFTSALLQECEARLGGNVRERL